MAPQNGWWLRSAGFALVVTLLGLLAPATGEAAVSTFDHATTGFELLGRHRDTACADCHVGGIFKGTPTDCFSCHSAGSRTGATFKPTTHIISNNNCAECHTPFGWTPVAQFNHLNVFGTCSSCHNNVQALGKPANHMPTTAECNGCHVVTKPFLAVTYPSNHIPTSTTAICANCHKGNTFAVIPSLTDIHLYAPSTSGNCAQCHGSAAPTFAIPANNFSVVGLPSNHIPVAPDAPCESCHVGAGSSIAATPVVDGAKFMNSAMSHAGLTTCVGCHGPTITASTFVGISKIVVMPPFSAPGAASHIPSGTACESCHAGSAPIGLVPGNATKTPPGTAFQTPIPTTGMIHTGITTNCVSCHESPYQWLDMTAEYPLNPAALTLGTLQYFGFHTRPGKAASATNLVDNAHPTSGDCSKCHTRTDYFEGQLKPTNHIPTAPSAQCINCHKDPDFSVMPALVDIHSYAPSTSSNCVQCHGTTQAPSFAIPAANFAIVTMPGNHVPTSAPCESCHVGATSSIAATPVPNGAKFTNSAMNHAGLTTCVGCHGPTITGSSFIGITKIIAMPATSPMGVNAHIPSGTACETCHAGSVPAGLTPANATKSIPGSGFQTPIPTTGMIHTGVASNCVSCHEGGSQWLDMMPQYPLTPGVLTLGTLQYYGFQTRPGKAATTTNILDNAHPTSGDCSQCHNRTDYFEGQLKPANHIPTAPTAQCTNCHTNVDFSVLPALVDIHTYAPSTSSNCAQCHGSAAASFAIPAANFSIVGMPANHVPTSAACEGCHVGAGSSITVTPVPNGAKFSGSAMSHAGLTTCVGCHGPTVTNSSFIGITNIIVMPATSPMGAGAHIPSGTACESCHAGSVPAGLVPANATKTIPGSGFQTPIPTTGMIHTGITSNCASCHEGAYLWLDMVANYPINPAALTGLLTTQYMGFQTRPGKAATTTNLLDGAHPTSGDCSMCHTRTDYFEYALKPANHIPTSTTAQCTNCHKNPDFSVLPALVDIHTYAPSTSSNCTQCHGSTTAPSFAIPAANFSIVTTPANHLPTTASCEVCHVGAGSSIAATPVPNGAKFTNSAMSHAGLTTCVGCHGPTISGASFYGITSIVVMPPSSAPGAGSHIPSGTACESCHAGSMPASFVPANATKTAPGTAFATPIPTTALIHGSITSGCSSCHDTAYVWMDMANYPISPTAVTGVATTQYVGFQTRPVAAAGTYNVADAAHPSSGDCSQCHTGTNYFSAQAEPANHIPTLPGAQCSVCHTTAGNFAVYTSNLTTLHSEVATTCSTCHADGKGPFAGAPGFTIIQKSTRGVHIPITNAGLPVECSGCHKTVTTFTGTLMSHAAIGDSATSAAGNACDACHEHRSTFYGFNMPNFYRDNNSPNHKICGPQGTPTAPNVTICANGGSDCLVGCHQHNNIPATYKKVRPGTPRKQLQAATAPTPAPVKPGADLLHRPGIGKLGAQPMAATGSGRVDHATLGGAACQSCHNGSSAAGKGPGHPATNTACGDCHSTMAWQPVLRVDHADVLGACVSCHNGTRVAGKPVSHPISDNDCDRCHTTSAWKPAAFDHKALVAGTCATCHNALQAPGKPAGHVMTTLSCDSCHYLLGWKPAKPPAVRPSPGRTPVPPSVPSPRTHRSAAPVPPS